MSGLICGIMFFASFQPQDARSPVEVQSVGEMRKVMRDGDLTGVVDLRKLGDRSDHLYALGPLEGLKGEVTVWDGKSHIARIRDGGPSVTTTFDAKACFLVYARVRSWEEVPIPSDVSDEKHLESFVARMAGLRGIDVKRPFPFAVKAKPKKLIFHIVNKVDDTPHNRESHDKIKVKLDVTNIPARLIGFYSDHHHGVFTHHDTNVHIHFVSEDGKQSGHVDSFLLGDGATLLLPKS